MRVQAARLAAAALLFLAACKPEPQRMTMTRNSDRAFGKTPEGVEVRLYTLQNAHGMRATITNYGGIVTSLVVPDRTGQPGDVVLGFDSLEGYLRGSPYFGAIVGRYANRIARARFSLDGASYHLAANDHGNALHGGTRGFDKVVWEATPDPDSARAALRLHYVSADGEEGYPGRLDVTVTYEVTDANELRITYGATTDKPTVLNLSHHGYFNLAGRASPSILSHQLLLAADRYTPVGATLIPTGDLASVDGTPFDFRTATAIGARIDAGDRQLRYGQGYDHNFEILGMPGTLRLAARLRDPESGRTMEVLTTEPGIQFYSGNFLDGTLVGKGGVRYQRRSGLCLETQHFPDAPHHADFPTTVLRPGQAYRSETVYRFSAQ
jgi:aldose 1-epimerase